MCKGKGVYKHKMKMVSDQTPADFNRTMKLKNKRKGRKREFTDRGVVQGVDREDKSMRNIENEKNVRMVTTSCSQVKPIVFDLNAKLSQENRKSFMDTTTNPLEKPSNSGRKWLKRVKRQANEGCVVQALDHEDNNMYDTANRKNGMILERCSPDKPMELDSAAKLSQENPKSGRDTFNNPLEKLSKSKRKRLRKARKKAAAKLRSESTDQMKSGGPTLPNPSMKNLKSKGKRLRKRRKKAATKVGLGSMDHTNLISNLSLTDANDAYVGNNINNGNLLTDGYEITQRRKLLILDVNGLLADVVFPAPQGCKPDIKTLGRAIFRRPFYLGFLDFCFERFDVGIWSSRTKKVLDKVVDCLLGDLKLKLRFCWDASYCTLTEFKTLENKHKPLVFKELRKLWEKPDPGLPWEKGDYDESNTLLLDDSPYKALLNPMHTGVFPCSYTYHDKCDTLLGPGGKIRVYLENLASARNVQHYVAQNPFGQSPINETNPNWNFYSEVLQSLLGKSSKEE